MTDEENMEARLTDLIARVETAGGPDREIDEVLFVLANGRPRNRSSFEQYEPSETLPAYTASIDADLGLVERKLPGQSQSILGEALDILAGEGELWAGVRYPQQLPLAILLALLRALSARSP